MVSRRLAERRRPPTATAGPPGPRNPVGMCAGTYGPSACSLVQRPRRGPRGHANRGRSPRPWGLRVPGNGAPHPPKRAAVVPAWEQARAPAREGPGQSARVLLLLTEETSERLSLLSSRTPHATTPTTKVEVPSYRSRERPPPYLPYQRFQNSPVTWCHCSRRPPERTPITGPWLPRARAWASRAWAVAVAAGASDAPRHGAVIRGRTLSRRDSPERITSYPGPNDY